MAPNKNIIICKDLDLNKITYSAPKVQDSGAKSIFIAYNGSPLIVQTPRLACPFGVKKWSNDPKNLDKVDKVNLELSFKGAAEKAVIGKALEIFKNLDAKLLDDALDNSMAWFKKKYTSTDVVEALYTPLVRYAKDKETGERTDKYPPTMRVSLPHVNGRVTCEVYNAAQDPIPDICAIETKGAYVRAIIQCTGVWVAGGKFGCSWKVVQLCVEPTTGISGFAFLDDDQVSSAASDHEVPDPRATVRTRAPLIANSSDEDEDDLDLPKARRVVKVVG